MLDLKELTTYIARLVETHFEFPHQRDEFENEVHTILREVELGTLYRAARKAREFDTALSDVHTVVHAISDGIIKLGWASSQRGQGGGT